MTDKHEHLKWKIERRELVFDARVAKIYRQHSKRDLPDDQREYTFLAIDCPDWCNIIAVTEDAQVLLIRQYRPGIDAITLEMPGGAVDPSERQIGQAALRELTEETGYELAPNGRLLELGWSYPNPAIQNNRCHFFACGPVRKTRDQNLDPAEVIDLELVDCNAVADLITGGKIDHALMLNSFLYLQMKKEFNPEQLPLGRLLAQLAKTV